MSTKKFKGFSDNTAFEVKPINVLSGANSGGKSTWIQLFLLIKQSLETRSSVSPLKLNNPYVKLGGFNNIVNKKKTDEKGFSVGFELSRLDISLRLRHELRNNFDVIGRNIGDVVLQINVEFSTNSKNKVVVEKFELGLKVSSGFSCNLLSLIRVRANNYKVATDYPQLVNPGLEDYDTNWVGRNVDVTFHGFFPDWIYYDGGFYDFGVVVSQARVSLSRVFDKFYYLGPLREEPKEFYYQEDDLVDRIGNKGENAAQLMVAKAKETINYPLMPRYVDGNIEVDHVKGTFQSAVNYWLCNVFGLAESIKAERAKSNSRIHTVTIKNKSGSLIPITHVGFGVSQVFPIIVEGLRAPQGSLIVLEQPEIHLHPKVQSLLFDFVVALETRGVKFLIETHSDHFINRLRRRVVEDDSGSLASKIGLMFVSSGEHGSNVIDLNLTDYGTLTDWPEGFFDQYDDDVRAIVKAQAAKRIREKRKLAQVVS